MSPRVGIYARQSVTVDEGIDQQVEACEAMLSSAHKDWMVVDRYLDNNTSASKERGPKSQWARMLRDVKAGKIDTIVTVAVDRLLRRAVDVIEVTAPKRPGLRVVTVRGGIDTGEPLGKFILSLFVLVAEQEIETKVERDIPFRAGRRAAGHPTSGRVPYGYRWIPKAERDKTGRRFAIVQEEADIVRFIFEQALVRDPLTGALGSLGAICRELNGRGARTRPRTAKTGEEAKPGARWGSPTVRRILLNPYYAALLPEPLGRDDKGKTLHYSPELVKIENCTPGNWAAIVTADQLMSARDGVLDPARRKNGGQTESKWLLPSTARCGAVLSEDPDGEVVEVCGAPIQSAWTREKYRGYRCPRGHFLRRAETIDEYVETMVVERLSRPDAASLVKPAPGIDQHALRTRRAALEVQAKTLLRWWKEGRYTEAQVETDKTEIDAEIAQINATLAEAARIDPVAELVEVADVKAAWDGLTLSRKQSVLRALFVVMVLPVGKGKRVTTREEMAASVRLRPRTALAAVDDAGALTLEHLITPDAAEALASQLN